MNKNEQILKERAAQYGSYADNVALYARYRGDLIFKFPAGNFKSKETRIKIRNAENLTLPMLALKLARLKPGMSRQAAEDSVYDFFNYFYLFIDYIFSFEDRQDVVVKFDSATTLGDQYEDELVRLMLSILVNKTYDKDNYVQILEFADLVLEEVYRV